MTKKRNQKKMKNNNAYGKSNKKMIPLVEKKFQKFVKNKKRRKTEKELQNFQELQIYNDEVKKCLQRSGKWRKEKNPVIQL